MKSEIRALEYAVTVLVGKLDFLLTTKSGMNVLGVSNGLHISTPEHLSATQDAFVTVRPVGWPKESRIDARFLRRHGGWKLFERGEIRANHLPHPFKIVYFKPQKEGLGVRIDATSDDQRRSIAEMHNRLIEPL